MSYPPVEIFNSTSHEASGMVIYRVCRDDSYTVKPGGHWRGPSRGVCLVTEITAILKTPMGDIRAKPYTSSGTSFSQFAIIQVGSNSFQVTRVVEGLEDAPPSDYVEPTEVQK